MGVLDRRLRRAFLRAVGAIAFALLCVEACTPFSGAADEPSEAGAPPTREGGASGPDATSPIESDGGFDASRPTTYRDLILSHQPAAYWRLGEPDGAPEGIVSETDPATSLTLLGGVAGVAGAIVGDENTAFELTGDNQGFEAANASLFDYDELEPFSLETWFRPTTVSATTRYLFCKQNVGTDTTRYGLYFNDGGGDRGLVFERVIDNDKRYARVPATVVTLDVWHHVVATYNGDSLALYLDGTIAASYVDVRPTQATTERLFVGKKSNTTGLRGGLDEVAIYPHALSSNQVREHWQMGAGVR